MNSQMGLGRRSLNGVDHWESNISADCFLHGTNILILPGDGTNGEYDANAICKIVERFLNNNFISGFDGHIFSAYYPDSANCGTHRLNQDAELGRLDDRLYPVAKKHYDYYGKFFDVWLLPLISKDGGQTRLDTETAAQNLSRLPVVSHCHGGPVLLELEKLFQQNMQRLGYTEEERRYIQKQLFVLDVASAMPFGQSRSTVLHIVSQHDDAAVKNWRQGSLNRFAQDFMLKDSPGALLELSPNENLVLLNRIYDNVKCMEQNIFTPSEHSADIYLDISTNSDIRDFAADLVLNEALLAASAAFSNAGERPDAAALFQSSPQVVQMRRDGQNYLSRFQYYRAGLLDAELKMFDGVLRHNPQTFKELPFAELLFRRDAYGKSAFEYVVQNGDEPQVKKMMAYLGSQNKNSPFRPVPYRHLEAARDYNFRQKRFDIYNMLIENGHGDVPAQIRAENMTAEDIPSVIPALKKCRFNSQSLFTLLPVYLKAADIADGPRRDETRAALFEMLTPPKLDIKNAFLLYKKAGEHPEAKPQKLQKAYQQHISAEVLKGKSFPELCEAEKSRQTDGRLYALLSAKAREHLEDVCRREKIQVFERYVASVLRSGALSDYKSYTLLYTRELDEAGRADFLARLKDFHARNCSKSEPVSALRAELKKYVRACNPDMNPASETAVFERLGGRGA